jgi:hypothetical protein
MALSHPMASMTVPAHKHQAGGSLLFMLVIMSVDVPGVP